MELARRYPYALPVLDSVLIRDIIDYHLSRNRHQRMVLVALSIVNPWPHFRTFAAAIVTEPKLNRAVFVRKSRLLITINSNCKTGVAFLILDF